MLSSLRISPADRLSEIYLPLNQALTSAQTPNWTHLIQTLAQVTEQSEELVCETVGWLQDIGPALTLPRFMPAATCESWVLAEVARSLGIQSVQWYLSHDKYAEFNPEKRLMLHHRVVRAPQSLHANRLRDQHLHSASRLLNGERLDQIQIENGHGMVRLVDFHRKWWKQMGWGGVEVDSSRLARRLLGDNPRKEQWYPVYFLLMCGNVIFLETYEPRYCLALWPLVRQVWESTCRLGHRPLLVRLPLTSELDWFLETAAAPVPKPVRHVRDLLLG